MAVEQQHGFPTDDQPTSAAYLRLKLEPVRFDGRVGPAPDDEPTETADLRIWTERLRPGGRAERRRVLRPVRLLANLAGLIRQFLSKLRL